jgi:adenine/guanine phosphoribosyltransferase-like PRPP-binding protein
VWQAAPVATTRVTEILRACYSHVEVAGRDGSRGVGVTNLKRVWGRPPDLRILVAALGRTVADVDAVSSADTGSAPLAAVVGYELGLASVFVREVPKEHLLSYGGDPATNDPRLFGERLRPGSTVHVIDDLVHSGQSLAAAVRLLRGAGLEVRGASCLLVAPETTGWRETLAAAGIERLESLATTAEL